VNILTEEHKHEVKHPEHHKPEHVHKEHKHIEHKEHAEPKKKVKLKKTHIWKTLTLVLGVLFIISLFTNGFSGKSSKVEIVDKQLVAKDAMEYINTYLMGGGSSAKLKEVTEEDDLYVITMDIGGREYDSYLTRDGKYLFPQGIDMTEEVEEPEQVEETPQEVPKSDKPEVEVFVMSHCPYGTQIEKGLLPVVDAIGNKADIEIKFVNYAMHGETEVKEQWNQYCIQKEQSDKYWDYLKCFLQEGDGEGCLTETGIDTVALETCKTAADEEFSILDNLEDKSKWSGGRFPLFLTHDAENKEYGVSGSPTLVINGQQVSSGRSSSALLTTICNAFNEPPAECDTELSSANPSAGFGFEVTGAATDAQC